MRRPFEYLPFATWSARCSMEIRSFLVRFSSTPLMIMFCNLSTSKAERVDDDGGDFIDSASIWQVDDSCGN